VKGKKDLFGQERRSLPGKKGIIALESVAIERTRGGKAFNAPGNHSEKRATFSKHPKSLPRVPKRPPAEGLVFNHVKSYMEKKSNRCCKYAEKRNAPLRKKRRVQKGYGKGVFVLVGA